MGLSPVGQIFIPKFALEISIYFIMLKNKKLCNNGSSSKDARQILGLPRRFD
jgi:hypothetical protein